METVIVAQRLIRSKGSKVGVNTGKVFTFMSLPDMIATAKRHRHVFSYVDSDGNEGTIRSGRKMRKVDSHVRNVTRSGLGR